MANQKITQFTEATSFSADTDLIPIVINTDSTPANRKMTKSNFKSELVTGLERSGSSSWALIGVDKTLGNPLGVGAVDLQTFAASTDTGASGLYSFAAGFLNKAAGFSSVALGGGNKAIGDYSFSTGYFNLSSGDYSTTIGFANTGSDDFSVAIGYENNVSGYAATAFGYRNTVTDHYSFSTGASNSIINRFSATIGYGLVSKGYTNIAVGSPNTDYTAVGGTNDPTSRMFIVGNGNIGSGSPASVSTRSDAFIVYKGGEVVAPSLTTSSIDTETTGKVLVTKEWVDTQTGPVYTSLVQLLNQTGSNAPVPTEVYNDTGETFIWSRVSDGIYRITSSDTLFTANKTLFNGNNGNANDLISSNINWLRVSDTIVEIRTSGDNRLVDGAFEIKIYP